MKAVKARVWSDECVTKEITKWSQEMAQNKLKEQAGLAKLNWAVYLASSLHFFSESYTVHSEYTCYYGDLFQTYCQYANSFK